MNRPDRLDPSLLDAEGATPLMRAIWAERPEEIDSLLTNGADPNARSTEGLTPLFLAVLTENTALIEQLLDRGADPNLGALAGVRPLSAAAFLGLSACVDVLLKHGANPQAIEADGSAALIHAARRGFPTVVSRLLDAGADLSQCDNDGRTPLHLAAWEGQLTVVDMLVARGAVVDGLDNQGFTPLLLAAIEKHAETVERLLRAGASPNAAQPLRRTTALIHAAHRGHANVVRVLLEGGADPNAREEGGRTALIYAGARGHRPCVQLLLAHGADQTIEATDGKQPIQFVPLPPIMRRAPTRKRKLGALAWHVLSAFSERRVLHGLQVSVAGANAAETTIAFQKVGDALDLVARHTPQHLRRMQQQMPRIFVMPYPTAVASYYARWEMCLLAGETVQDSKTPAATIASFLVHEATHARLTHLGFGYAERERTRVERLCTKAELALATKIPGAEGVVQQAQQSLDTLGPWQLSDTRLVQRNVAGMRKAGVPNWLVPLLARWARWRIRAY